jgi:tyrosinase
MTKKLPPAFDPSRRATLVKTGAALGASVLPFGLLAAGQSAPASASRPGTYRRYNASRSAAGKQMLKSYAKAVRAMLALPPEDPRNWYRHAIIHTLDCPHGNWWFLPWHRGYLGWFEQICRELSGDPRFTLPYWDWTAEPRVPDGMYFDVLDPNHEAYIPTASDFENRLRSAIANSGYWTSPGGVFTSRSQYGQLLARGVRFDEDLLFDILRDPRAACSTTSPARADCAANGRNSTPPPAIRSRAPPFAPRWMRPTSRPSAALKVPITAPRPASASSKPSRTIRCTAASVRATAISSRHRAS